MKKLFLFLGIVLLVPSLGFSQKGNKDADEKDKFTELTENTEYIEGYFDFYRTDDALYMALTKEQLNNDFIMNIEISRGIGSSFIFGGLMLNRKALLLSLEEREGKIFLVQKPYQILQATLFQGLEILFWKQPELKPPIKTVLC